MHTQLIITAVLAGFSTGVLATGLILCFAQLAAQRRNRRSRAQALSFGTRLKRMLKWVLIPDFVRCRWGGQATSLQLQQAGLALEADEYASLRWLSAWAGAIAAVLILNLRDLDLLGWFLASIGILSGWLGPLIWLKLRTERRRSEVDLALPDLLDRLSLGLNAGLSFESAFNRTARSFPGAFGEELRWTVREWNLGHTRSKALRALSERHPADSLSAFVAAVNQADELGTSLSETLRIQSQLLRSQRRRKALEASRRLPILIAFPLVFFFLPALLIIYLVPPLLTLFFGP